MPTLVDQYLSQMLRIHSHSSLEPSACRILVVVLMRSWRLLVTYINNDLDRYARLDSRLLPLNVACQGRIHQYPRAIHNGLSIFGTLI